MRARFWFFGMLSKEYEIPIHVFDVPADELIELDEGVKAGISSDMEVQKVELNLDRYIEMKGGAAFIIKLKTVSKLNNIVDDLATEGILLDVEHANGRCRFRFKNQSIKECLWEGGSILELYTFQKQK